MIWPRFGILNCCAYHLLTDLDPCINVSCKYFAVCKAFGPRDARCICVNNCPSFEEPVCSSNGTTYDNVCVFQREMCHLRANFTVYHPGDCTGNFACESLYLNWRISVTGMFLKLIFKLCFSNKKDLHYKRAQYGINNLTVE